MIAVAGLLHLVLIVTGVIVGAGATALGAARMPVAQPEDKRSPRHAPDFSEDGAGRSAAPTGAAPTASTQRFRT